MYVFVYFYKTYVESSSLGWSHLKCNNTHWSRSSLVWKPSILWKITYIKFRILRTIDKLKKICVFAIRVRFLEGLIRDQGTCRNIRNLWQLITESSLIHGSSLPKTGPSCFMVMENLIITILFPFVTVVGDTETTCTCNQYSILSRNWPCSS